ncbi:SDR family NAD(P)-dependent oxidoreductase [Dactylosporangium sp. CA-092794]|uniref:SDR family NAD(P)-dependent oxidoreductase n=1 Tax=Dactylosporangium sp. CA-092794 TaxID=3239929 RepID=UPI003D8E6A0C
MNLSTALVTGANKGIGWHIAKQLADAGLTVYVGSRDPGRGAEAARRIGAGARPLVLDVTDPAGIAAAAAAVPELDVLVNNAGIMPDDAAPPDSSVEAFRATYETNVFAVLAVTNAFLPALRRSAHPRIVNISSGTASLAQAAGRPGSGAAYRSSKAALNALTVYYAATLAADGFKVNALAPGLRHTGLHPRAAASDGDPAEGAAGAVRLALLGEDGPTGGFHSWDGTPVPW